MPPRDEKPTPLLTRPGQTIHQDVSLEHEMLIGRTIIAWSRLEQALEETIWGFLGVSVEDGRILTARLDAKFKMNLFRGLSERHMDKSGFQNMIRLLKRIDDLYATRSLVVHGNWITIMPDNIAGVMSLREKISGDSARNIVVTTMMPKDYMEAIIGHMIRVKHLLINLRREVLFSLHGIHPAPPEKD
jgi:hypothetical protein